MPTRKPHQQRKRRRPGATEPFEERMDRAFPGRIKHRRLSWRIAFLHPQQAEAIRSQVQRDGHASAACGVLYLALRRYRQKQEPRPDSLRMAETIQLAFLEGKKSLYTILKTPRPARPRRWPHFDPDAAEVARALWEGCGCSLTPEQEQEEDWREEMHHERWLESISRDDEWEFLHRHDEED